MNKKGTAEKVLRGKREKGKNKKSHTVTTTCKLHIENRPNKKIKAHANASHRGPVWMTHTLIDPESFANLYDRSTTDRMTPKSIEI
jgi:hypothetical protein